MVADMDQHPFRVWREAERLSRPEAADRIRSALVASGRKSTFSPEYLSLIENDHSRAGWNVAAAMEHVSNGRVRADAVMRWVKPVVPSVAAPVTE